MTEHPNLCSWYVLCDQPADGVVAHPILGQVPTCQRCADRHHLELAQLPEAPTP